MPSKATIRLVLVIITAVVAGITAVGGQNPSGKPPYLDASLPIEKRVEDLLGRMTLSEKVAQMNMPCVYKPALGSTVPLKQEACRKFTSGTYVEGLGPGGGFFTLADNILLEGPRQQAEYFNALQKIAADTRLKIPVLQSEEGTHGVMCSGGTIFPEGLGIGSTWDMALVEKIYTVEALEARSVGIHQLFTLVIEPNRDPRMGRNEEGFSEDPYFCSRVASAIVRGAQGKDVTRLDKVVAGLCHYPGQSQPVSGYERGQMEISERAFQLVFLPPWRAGITGEGALGVMATYPAIDDVPTHSSDRILGTILREQLGFRGLVLSEGLGISTLEDEHIVDNQKDAGAGALKAGVDVGISFEPAYMKLLIENVNEGKVSMELIDRAVRRILTQKFRLGLFEKPYVDVERAAAPRDAHRALSLKTAREGIVLLKNDKDLLPLKKDLKKVAVIGPAADDVTGQLGDYTAKTILQEIVTVRKGLERKLAPGTQVVYSRGSDHVGKVNEIQAAREAARQADAAIVVLGESHEMDGEGKDMATLELPAVQEELVKAVVETGTPTVVVLINGRPLATRWIAEHVQAVVEAWRPGEQGGTALADILFGDVNPSGRLPITVPRHVGQLPVYYNHKPSKDERMEGGYVDLPGSPLYAFGHGLSYTKFQYGGLKITPDRIRPDGQVRVSFQVKNVGSRAGQEVAQLYLRDVLSSVSRPVKELRGFEKVALEPGEVKSVEFALGFDDLSLLDRNMQRVVEPGQFRVMIGSASDNVKLSGFFDVDR